MTRLGQDGIPIELINAGKDATINIINKCAITYGKPENGQKIGRDQPLYQYLKKEMQEVATTTGQ